MYFFSRRAKQFASDIRKKMFTNPKVVKNSRLIDCVEHFDFGLWSCIHTGRNSSMFEIAVCWRKKTVYCTTQWGFVSHWVSRKTKKFHQQPKDVFISTYYYFVFIPERKKGNFVNKPLESRGIKMRFFVQYSFQSNTYRIIQRSILYRCIQ